MWLISEISQPVDLVFAVDASSGISDTNFTEFKVFLRNALDAYKLSPHDARISIVLFGNDVKIVNKLGSSPDKDQLLKLIDGLSIQGRWKGKRPVRDFLHETPS